MSATMTERLDELLAMAREAGSLDRRLADLEHKRDSETGYLRKELTLNVYRTRKELERVSAALESARARFTKDLP